MKRPAVAPMVLRPLRLPPHERTGLGNGLGLHVVPRGPLPLVAVRLVVHSGTASDDPERLGVADFAARLLRRGAGGLDADQLSQAIELVGASLGGFAAEESFVVSMSTPTKHVERMLELFAKVVLEPTFPEAEVALHRRRSVASLVAERDDPSALADRALGHATWGSHPYGRDAAVTTKQLGAVSPAALRRFHRERLGPAVANLFVVGDVRPDAVRARVDRLFSTWRGGPTAPPRVPELRALARPGQVMLVDKADQTQVQVRLGAMGVPRGHPDHFPIGVMNAALGGGFTSRLMREIRVKRGLSYGAGSSFEMLRSGGLFSFSSFTKTDSVTQLLDVALGEISKMRQRGPTAREVSTVQRYIAGLFPARLETNEAVAGALADVEHYGLPDDWLATYRERIAAVTVAQARAAARAHLFDDERCLVLVGNAKALERVAARFGEPRVLKPEAVIG